jgi:UDP-3-O-[3-hydroxymyristoyl] glucosamine N-acyltransferase
MGMVVKMMQESKGTYTAAELADEVAGELIGDPSRTIVGVSSVGESRPKTVVFAENKKYLKQAEESKASLVIINNNTDLDRCCLDLIMVDNPRLSYAKIASLFEPNPYFKPGVDSSAVIADSVELGNDVSIHAQVVIDKKAVIGDNVILAPGVYVGKNVEIAANTLLHPNVVLEYDTVIGKNVIIQSGTVIGSDGYGYTTDEQGHHKIPQLGRVIIEDGVEIGANVTIDRGTNQPTVVQKGTKIDNLVQIAHNVQVGQENLIVAQVGIAGSSRLGRRVTVAGQAGIVDHTKIGTNTTIASNSLVTKDTPEGVFYSGNPAHAHQDELKELAGKRRLPELIKKIENMEEEIERLQGKVND